MNNENVRYTIYTSKKTKEILEELSKKTQMKKGKILDALLAKLEKCSIENLEDFVNIKIRCKK